MQDSFLCSLFNLAHLSSCSNKHLNNTGILQGIRQRFGKCIMGTNFCRLKFYFEFVCLTNILGLLDLTSYFLFLKSLLVKTQYFLEHSIEWTFYWEKRRPQQNNKKYINLQSEGSTHNGWECKDDMKLVLYDEWRSNG